MPLGVDMLRSWWTERREERGEEKRS